MVYTWNQQNTGASWSARAQARGIFWNGYIWVINGTEQNGPSYGRANDVWRSSDGGITWERTGVIGGVGRAAFALVVFNSRLWLLGGSFWTGAVGYGNPIYSTADGETWTYHGLAAWTGRHEHGAVAFNGRMYVFGGFDGTNALNDIWSSADGINWTQETPAGTMWGARREFGYTVFNNRVWIFGGDIITSFMNDVWYTSDMINWSRATDAAPWIARREHGAASGEDLMWISGGNDASNDLNDTWRSSDGINWTQLECDQSYTPRGDACFIDYSNALFILGGLGASGLLNDVWVVPYRIDASFTVASSTGMAPFEVQFNNTSGNDYWYDFPPEGAGIVTYHWDFGDGTTSTEPSPVHTYEIAGVYTVTLTTTDASGYSSTQTTTIYVRDWDYASYGGTITDRCLRYALRPAQGRGWSYYRSVGWIFPIVRNGTLEVTDDNGQIIPLVWHARNGRPYRLGEEVWYDRVGAYSAYPIATSGYFAEDRGSAEHYNIESTEHHLYFRPWSDDDRGASGHDATGYLSGFQVNLGLIADGNRTSQVRALNIPITGDIVHDRRFEGHRIQPFYETTASKYRLVKRRSYYVAKDQVSTPGDGLPSEQSWQEAWCEPVLWLSRGPEPMLNRATGVNASGSYFSLVTGPDGYAQTAMNFSGAESISDTVLNLSGDFTMSCWVLANVATMFAFAGGAMRVDIGPELRFTIGSQVFIQEFSGSGWIYCVATRSGNLLRLYVNGVLVQTYGLSGIVDISGTISIMPASSGAIFNPTVLASAVSDDAVLYHYNDVANNNGNTFLPEYA